MIDECGEVNGMRIGRVKPKYLETTIPTSGLSTTNPK
jgi:hypothetical protein